MKGLVKRRPVGRPATGMDPVRSVRLSPGIMKAIAMWRLKRLDLDDIDPDKPVLDDSKAIRELLLIALEVEGIEVEE